jgi:hypothetical protein
VNAQVCLPEDGLWSLEWHGVVLREELLSMLQSKMTAIDLTTGDKELLKCHREEVSATNELAKNMLVIFRALFANFEVIVRAK